MVEIKERKEAPLKEALRRQGEGILKQSSAYVLVDEKGRQMTSAGFASFMSGKSRIDFVLGGPYGVSDEVRAAAGDAISLSRMTLTHEMARLLFLEQLYRAMTIIKGRGYHH